MKKGRYDLAVNAAVKKLLKKPDSEKDILNLEKAYPRANKEDLDRVKYLQATGSANRWEDVFNLYKRLDRRQDYVQKVLPIKYKGRTIDFPMEDYDALIAQSKSKAKEYYFKHAKKLLESNDKEQIRQAFYEFQKVKQFDASFPDIDNWMNEALDRGTSYVLVTVKNSTRFRLSNEFKENLLLFGSEKLDQDWVQYYIKTHNDRNVYDYKVLVNLKSITVSPETMDEHSRVESKKVKDGWEYELDRNGNVKKDTLGNDIKRQKYKTIKCRVHETVQYKSAHIEGAVEYIENNSRRVLKKSPIAADQVFEHLVVTANGDLDALSPKTKKMIGGRPLPFPSDLDLIYGATETLGHVVRDVLHRNRKYIK